MLNVRENQRTIKNGIPRVIANIWYTRNSTKTKETQNVLDINKNVDIKFSAHDAFLEYATLKAKISERQII